MREVLRKSELFEDLDAAALERFDGIARPKTLRAEEYLFLLGDSADRLYVVLSGKLDTCLPLTLHGAMQDVTVESKVPGEALGWSALVRPYRFTLSARAAEPSEVVGFPRQELTRILDEDARVGVLFNRRLAEMVGHRLLKIQAMWSRELQRAVADDLAARSATAR